MRTQETQLNIKLKDSLYRDFSKKVKKEDGRTASSIVRGLIAVWSNDEKFSKLMDQYILGTAPKKVH